MHERFSEIVGNKMLTRVFTLPYLHGMPLGFLLVIPNFLYTKKTLDSHQPQVINLSTLNEICNSDSTNVFTTTF